MKTESKQPRLLDLLRAALRLRHYSYKTEKNYVAWVKRYIYFHKKQHPKDLGAEQIVQYLTFLAVKGKVAAGTQNQALCAIIFLYKHVLKIEPGELKGLIFAKRPRYIPPILSEAEMSQILAKLQGTKWLMVSLLYGTAMRLTECLRLRVKDLDFDRNQIVIRDAKGEKDRIVMFPQLLKEPLKQHLAKTKILHEKDLKDGFGTVEMPYALERKYPNANKEWGWKYVFPSYKRSIDPRSGVERRHHVYESILQDDIRNAVRSAGITKRVTAHSFRHSAATSWLQRGADIRTVQELLGHNDLKTTMIYTHVLERGPSGTPSPLDAVGMQNRYSGDTSVALPKGQQSTESPVSPNLSIEALVSAANVINESIRKLQSSDAQ